MIPYDLPMIVTLLRRMPDARLASVRPVDFQRHPAPVVIAASKIASLIANERAVR